MMLSNLYWLAYRNHPGVKKKLKEQARFQNYSDHDKTTFLVEKTRVRLQAAAKLPNALPEWNAVSRIHDTAEFAQAWQQLPITTKDDLNHRFSVELIQKHLGGKGEVLSTGGSTGEPTRFVHDTEMKYSKAAASYQSLLLTNWKPGIPVVCIWGSERDIGRQTSRKNRYLAAIRGQHFIAGYQLDDKVVDKLVQTINQHQQLAVYGFTSMLEYVAERVLERGILIPENRLIGAWSGGETVKEEQQERFQQAFGLKFLNFYGGRETGAIATETIDDKSLQVFQPHLLIEVVDDTGKALQPGEVGRVLVTCLGNGGTPFIRYEIGDLAVSEKMNPHHFGAQSLSRINGRLNGLINLPNGKRLCGLFWNHMFKEYPEISQFQIVIKNTNHIEVNLVGERASDDLDRQLMNRLRQVTLGMQVTLVWRSELLRSQEGKLNQVIRM